MFKILGRAIADFVRHDGIEHAGYIAFLLMLSVFPFFFFFISLVNVLGTQGLAEHLVQLVLESSWAGYINVLKPGILKMLSSPPSSLLTAAVVSAIWTASSIFEALRTFLNRSYRVVKQPSYFTRRFYSIIEFSIASLLIVLITLLLVVIPGLWSIISEYVLEKIDLEFIRFFTPETKTLRFLMLVLFGAGFVTGIYYFLPNRKQHFYYTLPGTVLVLNLWMIFTWAFKYYIFIMPSMHLVYGSIASIVIALLFFYVSSIIFLIGGEFNYQIERLANVSLKPMLRRPTRKKRK